MSLSSSLTWMSAVVSKCIFLLPLQLPSPHSTANGRCLKTNLIFSICYLILFSGSPLPSGHSSYPSLGALWSGPATSPPASPSRVHCTPATWSCQAGFLLTAFTLLMQGPEQYFPQCCMANSFSSYRSQGTCRLVRKAFPISGSHITCCLLLIQSLHDIYHKLNSSSLFSLLIWVLSVCLLEYQLHEDRDLPQPFHLHSLAQLLEHGWCPVNAKWVNRCVR